jgi:hypothetical protein
MAGIVDWIKKTVENLVDPEKDERFKKLLRALSHGISKQQESFSLSEATGGLNYTPSELATAQQQVYRMVLARGWADGKLSAEEQGVARWVAERLELSGADAQRINLQFARDHFSRTLAQSMEDGVLDSNDERRLREIAASIGFSLPQFANVFFQEEGEAFLRGIFSSHIADGRISQAEWDHLLGTAEKLGIPQRQLLDAIQPQAWRFVEHVLADAKMDERFSSQEEATLQWLLDNLGLPLEFLNYVRGEVETLRLLTEIGEGRLPSVPVPSGIEIRAGEIVHFYGVATWLQVRLLKSGPRRDDHTGNLVLTDNRLVFSSSTKSQSIGYRKIVSHQGGRDRIEAQVEGQPTNTFFLGQQSLIPYAIFTAAVAMANQTKVARQGPASARQIPRDVRQRVWQRYAGRCAECGAGDYLEFDHIIPVAKGGGNSDSNVQLLCRRCNLKKSDAI